MDAFWCRLSLFPKICPTVLCLLDALERLTAIMNHELEKKCRSNYMLSRNFDPKESKRALEARFAFRP
jgi:hypothetical protein